MREPSNSRTFRDLLREVKEWRADWKRADRRCECSVTVHCDQGYDPNRDYWGKYFRNADGTHSLNADYSGGVNLDLVCPPDSRIAVNRILWQIRASARATSSQEWGSRSELNFGLRVQRVRGGDVLDLTDVQRPGEELRTNANWGGVCYDTGPRAWGEGDDYIHARWTFGRSGAPLWLVAGDRLRLVLADDMTTQSQQTVMAQGQVYRLESHPDWVG